MFTMRWHNFDCLLQMFVIAPGWQGDSNDLSATLMEAWAGGEWSTDVFCPFQQNLFFTTLHPSPASILLSNNLPG